MNIPCRKPRAISDDLVIGQYQALRASINRMQDARAVVLGGLLTIVGTIVVPQVIGILLKKSSPAGTLSVALLVSFGGIVVLASAILVAHYTRGIERIGMEIRDHIEPRLGDGNFEQRSQTTRLRKGPFGLRLRAGASRAFSIALLLISAFLAVLLVVGGDRTQPWAMLIAIPPLALGAVTSADLWARLTKFWVIPG